MASTITQLLILTFCAQLALSSMDVVIPLDLRTWWDANPDLHHVSWATFGNNPWGRKVMGRLKLAEPLNACTYLKSSEEDVNNQYIYVAKRGDCTFVVKSHYAQLAGAKLLIIVDNKLEDVDQRLMVDDGNLGTTVHIPVGLITKGGGDKLIQSLQTQDEMINIIDAIFNFEIPKYDTVTYKLWLSSSTSKSFQFVSEWKRAWYPLVNTFAKMEVHYAHPIRFGATEDDPDCLCGGKYCAADPDGLKDNTGADVLLEDLRQVCILNSVSEEAWWTYMTHFDTFCLEDGELEKCSDIAMAGAGISKAMVNDCVKNLFDSRNPEKCKTNKYLDEQEALMREEAVYIFPDVTIQNFAFRGNMVPSISVFQAICESFNTMPEACVPIFKMETGDTAIQMRDGTAQVVFASVIFLILFAFIVFTCYRRYLRRILHKEMVRDVNIAVSQYIAMSDNENNRETRRFVDN